MTIELVYGPLPLDYEPDLASLSRAENTIQYEVEPVSRSRTRLGNAEADHKLAETIRETEEKLIELRMVQLYRQQRTKAPQGFWRRLFGGL